LTSDAVRSWDSSDVLSGGGKGGGGGSRLCLTEQWLGSLVVALAGFSSENASAMIDWSFDEDCGVQPSKFIVKLLVDMDHSIMSANIRLLATNRLFIIVC
jgi:hypothetical protein